MLKILKSNKVAKTLIILTILSHTAFCFSKNIVDPIEQWHSTSTIHGLYEIREEARKFIIKENSINNTEWIVNDPNHKIIVSRCLVPLKVKWVPNNYGLSKKSVFVYCEKTKLKGDKWSVTLSVGSSLSKNKNKNKTGE